MRADLVRRFLGPIAAIVATFAVVGVVLAAPLGPGPLIVAKITGDEPDAVLARFAGAISSGDIDRAKSMWTIGPNEPPETRERLESRKAETWRTLAGLVGAPYVVERMRWWNACCEPTVIPSSEGAGGAQYWVRFGGSLRPYVVTLTATDVHWVFDRLPARGWGVREVYLDGEEPIYYRERP